MAGVDVVRRRLVPAGDPAAVWALVADFSRFDDWAPVRQSGWLGSELPAVGHVVYAKVGLARRPVQLQITAWEAGHRYRLELQRRPVAGTASIDVIVAADVAGGAPSARVELRYAGETKAWLGPFLWFDVRRRFDRALAAIEKVLRT